MSDQKIVVMENSDVGVGTELHDTKSWNVSGTIYIRKICTLFYEKIGNSTYIEECIIIIIIIAI